MTRQELIKQIRNKKSFLCIGLDSDIDKIPKHLLSEQDPVFSFNKAIIDATSDFAVAYKPNTAFYESRGLAGWQSLERTIAYLNTISPKVFTIADAKRGDIGNTSTQYAKAFFEKLAFDAITVTPYMGKDSVSPFLEFEGKWSIVLALTSNTGASDFQLIQNNEPNDQLYQRVLEKSKKWGTDENMMFVVGATKAEMLVQVRKHIPNHFILVPGVGAQGGSLEEVAKFGMNKEIGLLVNSSRAILYASSAKDFAEAARAEALKLQQQMAKLMI
ncbi:MAG TPA: orotidine-5'-phosphate decarboxylase [Bacteroidales bacterium]|nr:orotidine-5'-phosphate decarboxylase [Bacteroidales bacterium]